MFVSRWAEVFWTVVVNLPITLHDCPRYISYLTLGGGGGMLGTLFRVQFFHIFSVVVKLNVGAHMGSNTLGLQFDLPKFDTIHKGK
jgi:hypothetical protein